MIGGDELEQAFTQRSPEQLAVALLADRRSALVRGRAVADLLGDEVQVVRTRLRGERQPFRARLANQGKRAGRRVMNDVRARARLAAEAGDQLDRVFLGGGRP